MIKKLLIAAVLFFPLISSASITTGWSATSTDKGGVSPTLINGWNPWLNIQSIGTSTFSNGINISTGCFSIGGICVGGSTSSVFPFTPNIGYNSTSTVIGFNGLFSTASSTFGSALYLTNLSQGALYTGSLGLTQTTATGTVSNGAGISVTAGQSILGSGLVITNTSPDQTVVLNAGDGISISSAYPNFTIYNPFAIATDTSNFSQGNLTYLEQASGKTKLGSVATTTLSGSGVISVTNGATVIGGSPITVSCATCASTANNIATTSTIAIPQVAYFTKTGGVTTLGGAATSTPTAVDLTLVGSGATIGSLQVNNPFAIATTSGIAQGQLPYYTQTSGKTTIGGVATNTISGSGVISVTAGASVISGSPITVSCATCGTGSGSVTSITAGNDLLAATNPITTTGTINAQVGTSSVPTIPSLSYWTSVGSASNPARLGSVATSSVSAGTGITFSGTAGALVGGTSLTINGTDIYRIATTSDIAVPNLAYFTKTGGVTTLGSAATTSATINNGLTGTLTTIGGSQTIGLATINAGVLGAVVNSAVPTSQATSTLYGVAPAGGYVLGWDNTKNGINWIATSTGGGGTVSSVAVGSGLSASPSPITTTGTLTNPFAISTTSSGASPIGASKLAYFTTTIPTQLAGVATSSETCSSPLSCTAYDVLTGGGAITIANAVADSATKGAASFTANDFDASSGNISLDYTNGQKASGSQPGFLSSTDWTTFNGKGSGTVTSVATGVGLSGGTITGSGTLTNPYAIATSSSLFPVSGAVYVSQASGLTTIAAAATSTPTGGVGISLTGVGATIGSLQINNPNAVATSSSLFAISGVTYVSKVSGLTTLASVATSSETCTSPLSCTAHDVLTGGGAITIANAVADGSTKGAASFTANDFDATTGNISIDYTNGQKATDSVPGFLTAADHVLLSGKLSAYDSFTHAVTTSSATTSTFGIGSSTPFAALSVSTSTANYTGQTLFSAADSTNLTKFNVLGNGNVGIATATPGTLFSIQGVGNFSSGTSTLVSALNVSGIFTASNAATSTFTQGINLSAGCFAIRGTCLSTGSSGLASYDAWTHGVPGISATTSYIGIGSSTPRSQLSVSTSSASSNLFSLFSVASTTNDTLFSVLNQGQVGVGGTTSPIAQFTEFSASTSASVSTTTLFGLYGNIGTVATLFTGVDRYGRTYQGGPAPTTDCAGGIVGDDMGGQVISCNSPTANVTFSHPFPNGYTVSCVTTFASNLQAASDIAYISSESVTGFSVKAVSGGSIRAFNYQCHFHTPYTQ